MPRFWIAKRSLADWERIATDGAVDWLKPNDARPGDMFLAVESARAYHSREVIGFGRVREVGIRHWIVELTMAAHRKPPVLAILPPPVGYGRQVVSVPRVLYERLLKEVSTHDLECAG